MNKIYKVVWSKVKNCYVVVSEIAKNVLTGGVKISAPIAKEMALGALMAFVITGNLGSVNAQTINDNLIVNGTVTINDMVISTSGNGYTGIVIGNGATSNKDFTVSIGYNSLAEGMSAVAIGDAAKASSSSNISLGQHAESHGEFSMALGLYSYASGNNSVAFGENAVSKHNNSVAIGYGSVTQDVDTVSFGHKKGDLVYGSGSASTYNENYYRRLTNVADGIDSHDVATRGQLDVLEAEVAARITDSDTYYGTEIYKLKQDKADKAITLAGYGITDAYTKTEADGIYATHGQLDVLEAEVAARITESDTYYGAEFYKLKQDKADKADTLAGYGITNAYTKGEVDSVIAGAENRVIEAYITADNTLKSEINTKITNKADKATTLAGYGITDAYTQTQVNAKIVEATSGLLTDANLAGKADKTYVDVGIENVTMAYQVADDVVRQELVAEIQNVTRGFVAAGNDNYGGGNLAVGEDSSTSGSMSTAVGYGAISGQDSTAIGYRTQAEKSHSVAVGNQTRASADGTIAIGYTASAYAKNAIAIGSYTYDPDEAGHMSTNDTNAGGVNSIAIGGISRANAADSIAIGMTSHVSDHAPNGIAIGAYADAQNAYNVVIGARSIADADYSIALGAYSNAAYDNSVALGAYSTVTTDDSVSLGFKKDDGTAYTRTIQYVTAGVEDTDAVNVAQLKSKADRATTLEGYGITDAYTKSEVNDLLSNSAGGVPVDAYTKAEVDAKLKDFSVSGESSNSIKKQESSFIGSMVADDLANPSKAAMTYVGFDQDMVDEGVFGINSFVKDGQNKSFRDQTATEIHDAVYLATSDMDGDATQINRTVKTLSSTVSSITSGDKSSAFKQTVDGWVFTVNGESVSISGNDVVVGKNSFNELANKVEVIGSDYLKENDKNQLVGAIANKADVSYVDSSVANVTSAYQMADTAMESKLTQAYQAADSALSGRIDETQASIALKANASEVYTKTEIDASMSNKADKATNLAGYGIDDAYTKSEVDNLLSNSAGGTSVDAYTKTEVEDMLAGKVDVGMVAGSSAVAIGDSSQASGAYSVAIGLESLASNESAIALGDTARATGRKGIAIGREAEARGEHSIAVGVEVNAYGENAIAIGEYASASNDHSVAIGVDSITHADSTVSFGYQKGDKYGENNERVREGDFYRRLTNVADGIDAHDVATVGQLDAKIADATSGLLTDANLAGKADKADTLAGYGITDAYTKTEVEDMLAGKVAANVDSVVIGSGARALASSSIAIGNGAVIDTDSNYSIAIGLDSFSDNDYSIALGGHANATGLSSLSIGQAANSQGEWAIAIGAEANAYGEDSIAMGCNSQASGEWASIAIGCDSIATGDRSISLGRESDARGDWSIAIGEHANAYGKRSIAIGENASATHKNSVAIGRDSVTYADDTVSFGHSIGDKYGENNERVHDDNHYRRLTNIADGIDARDAVTVGQLDAKIADATGGLLTNANLIGKADRSYVDAEISYVTNAYKAADTALETKITKGYQAVGNALSVRIAANEKNISTVNTKISSIDKEISSKANKATTLSGYGITDAYTKAEIDKKLKNTASDANIEELNGKTQNISDKTTVGNTVINGDVEVLGNFSAQYSTFTQGASFANDSVRIGSDGIVRFGGSDKTANVTIYSTGSTSIDAKGAIVGGSLESKGQVTATGNIISIGGDVKAGDISLKETANALAGKADKADTLSGYGITDAYTKAEVDSKFDDKVDAKDVYTKTDVDDKLTDKADTAYVDSTFAKANDVYTKAEADATFVKRTELATIDENGNIVAIASKTELGENFVVEETSSNGSKMTINEGTDNEVAIASDGITIGQHSVRMDSTGFYAGGDKPHTYDSSNSAIHEDGRIKGAGGKFEVATDGSMKVANGKFKVAADGSMKAADGKFVVAADGSVISNDVNISELSMQNAEAVSGLNQRLGKISGRLNKVGAGAAALAALNPLEYNPDDKLNISAGIGNYAGETAAALGAFYRPDEKLMFSLGGTMGNGEDMVNLGVTIGLDGAKGAPKLSRKELIQIVAAMHAESKEIKTENESIKAENVALEERVAKLEALVAKLAEK